MAVVYFTSNASTGAGSLAEAVKNAQPGDVIRPDETVFERGARIEIALASTLTIDKNLTLDASPFRVVLNGDGLPRCCNIANGVNVEITSFRLVGGGWNSQAGAAVGSPSGAGLLLDADSNATLNRCEIYGCRGIYGGGLSCSDGSTARLNDCVVAGCAASGKCGGVRSRGVVDIYGSTIIGAAGSGGDVFVDASGAGRVTLVNSIVGSYSGNVEVGPGCVVGVAPSALGFVAPPPDDLTPETWDANAWQGWNLRLLDDASPNPSPYRDSGDVDAASKYDLDGNFRGRETNGAATCSPGAYETIQADLFWIGRDAAGAEVETPSFLTSDGWAASRFATVGGDIALTRFIVGGCAAIRFAASGTQTLLATFFDVGIGALVESTAGTQKLGVRDVASISRFGEYAYVKISFSTSDNASFQIAPTARFSSFANAKIVYRQGFFDSYHFNVGGAAVIDGDVENVASFSINATSASALTATNSPRIVCKSFAWHRIKSANAADSSLTDGSTPLVVAATQTVKISGAVLSSDCRVDVSRAEPNGTLALTLTGQTVYGDAPTAEITLNGVAQVDARGLDVASLATAADASLSVNGGSAKAATLTLVADSTLTLDGANVCVAELTVADGATVAFSLAEPPDATDGANVIAETGATGKTTGNNATDRTDATYVDAVLTATESATVGAATFTGVGYFATPPGTDVTAATFAEDVRACDYGAGISAFSAVATSPTEAAIEWSATDETATFCVERKMSSGWEVVDVRGESGLTAAIATPGATVFRAFDGAAFWSDSAWFLTGEQFTVETDFFAVAEDGAESVEYETETHIVTTNIDKSIYWGQSLTFLARIRNAFTGELLLNDGTRTKGVRYSLYRREGSLFSTSEDDVPVRLDVDAGAACLLETAQTSDAWPGVEYNFALIPANSADEPLIPAPGNYVLRVFVELTTGNPIVFVYTFAAR